MCCVQNNNKKLLFFLLISGTMSPALGMAGLSAGFSGGMPPLQQLQAHLLRSGPLVGSLPGSPFLHYAGLYNSPFSAHQSLYMPSLQHSLNIKQEVNTHQNFIQKFNYFISSSLNSSRENPVQNQVLAWVQ